MALTPQIIDAETLPRDSAAALSVRPVHLGSVDDQVNMDMPLTKRSTRAVLLGESSPVVTSKPRVAVLLRSSIGAELH